MTQASRLEAQLAEVLEGLRRKGGLTMPRRKPFALTSSAELDAMVERAAPAVLGLLADGVPRSKPAIVEALAGRHARDDVVHTPIRLAVTGQVVDTGGKYALAASEP